uniref:Uncharacterized protein n=1 Tax=Anguilla anguilla TaxID=7936 RepID=A0A0E9X139_ANGAN
MKMCHTAKPPGRKGALLYKHKIDDFKLNIRIPINILMSVLYSNVLYSNRIPRYSACCASTVVQSVKIKTSFKKNARNSC